MKSRRQVYINIQNRYQISMVLPKFWKLLFSSTNCDHAKLHSRQILQNQIQKWSLGDTYIWCFKIDTKSSTKIVPRNSEVSQILQNQMQKWIVLLMFWTSKEYIILKNFEEFLLLRFEYCKSRFIYFCCDLSNNWLLDS